MYDIDNSALERTKTEIYPSRYGVWDTEIKLLSQLDPAVSYNLAIIGTPPDTHVDVAVELLNSNPPQLMLIEKPLCRPLTQDWIRLTQHLDEIGCNTVIGYNHNFTENTRIAEELVADRFFGNVTSIDVRWLEHWDGIFSAHPWLDGPSDCYLGHWKRGGGACAEHSHAISLWQHFSRILKTGEITTVTAQMEMVHTNDVFYDQATQICVQSETGLTGTIQQDVLTNPPEKSMHITGEKGYLKWYANYDAMHDAVQFGRTNSTPKTIKIPKTRPDDFVGQVLHLEQLMSGEPTTSPNSLQNGLCTMEVISAAHLSNFTKKSISLTSDDWKIQLDKML